MSKVAHMTNPGRTGGVVPEINIGTRVLIARTHAGLEQQELSDLTGLSRGTIGNYEKGRVKPRRAGLISISFATGVDLGWLETGKTPDRDPVGYAIEGDPHNWWANRDSNPEPAGLVSLGA